MGLAQIKMPQLGESVTEGTVDHWLKNEGDFVKRDEPLVEVVTDKVNAEIPSPFEGSWSRSRPPRERPCRWARSSRRSRSPTLPRQARRQPRHSRKPLPLQSPRRRRERLQRLRGRRPRSRPAAEATVAPDCPRRSGSSPRSTAWTRRPCAAAGWAGG